MPPRLPNNYPPTPPLLMYLHVYLDGLNTAKNTTTTLQHTRMCPVSRNGEENHFDGQQHAPSCVAPNWAVDTIQNATQTPEPPISVQVIPTKTTAGTEATAATVDHPLGATLDNVRKRLSDLRRFHASHQDFLHSVTIQVTINHTAKIVGQGDSTLLLSARGDDKKDVS